MLTWCRSSIVLRHVRLIKRHLLCRALCIQPIHQMNDISFPPCGQPTPTSHPHLLKPGELIPGFKRDEFVSRRHFLMRTILSNSHAQGLYNIFVIPSAVKSYMTGKIPYVFRQDTDFLYFSGCLEPDSILVIHGSSEENFSSDLFLRSKDAKAELWDGPRTGMEVATALFSVDKAHSNVNLAHFLQSLGRQHPSFCLWYDNTVTNDQASGAVKHMLSHHAGKSWFGPKLFFHQIRLIKSDSEQDMMRQTCALASEAFGDTIGFTQANRTEHELQSKFEYEIKMRGAQLLAYPPVVASGNNANIIHYIDNNQLCRCGDLVLMDAGCELNGYDSDITRTWPVEGMFSEHQRVLYEIVLDTQQKLIKLCDRLPSLDELFSAMCTMLGESLVNSHVVAKTNDSYGTIGFKFCPHHASHYLGMDVHDCASIPRSLPVVPGVVFTVEPGLYMSHEAKDVRQEFRGLGIRIEDDILIDNEGRVENLTDACPKTVHDIEAICRKKS